MFETMMNYLENNILSRGAELSKRDKDLASHKAFLASRTSLYVGEVENFKKLNKNLHRCKF